MSLHHHILAWAYPPLKIAMTAARNLGLAPQDRLRVLIHHDIAPAEHERFAAQLRWLARTWNFVSPERFAAMMSGEEPIRGSHLLLTFDDGFASNRIVAEQILNPMGIRALFFVVSDLVPIDDRVVAREFIARHIYLGTRAEALPAHWCNMGWNDLSALLEQGHSIGGHTRTHPRLAEVRTDAELQQEIIASADVLELRLGVRVEHFSSPFGDLGSYSAAALAMARRRFRFLHTGLRGDNVGGVLPCAVRRDSAAQQDAHANYTIFSNALLGAFLEGAADFHYAAARTRLNEWAMLRRFDT